MSAAVDIAAVDIAGEARRRSPKVRAPRVIVIPARTQRITSNAARKVCEAA
jgi:hypothetical protein